MGNLSVKTLGYPSFLSQVVPVEVRGGVFSGTMFRLIGSLLPLEDVCLIISFLAVHKALCGVSR